MLNLAKGFVVFLIWTLIALTTHYFITHKYFNNCNISSQKTISKEIYTPQNQLLIIDNADTIYNSSEGITIYKNEDSLTIPQDLIEKLNTFISNNYNKKLKIKSYYSSEESTSLGNLRNKNIVTKLTNSGISNQRIETTSQLKNIKFNTDNSYNNGVSISIQNRKQKVIDSLENSIVTNRLYVDVLNNKLEKTKELKTYTKLLKQYLKLHPTKTIYITGHTDNKGYFQNNLIKGQLKADKLKEHFIENGIDITTLQTFSRGEAEPIANKYTIKGKQLNNRIEINIK